ncbi:hypothetical protein PR202_gb10094 [Eleusine coracana subsp. coracana]|uniref:F-box domain-containing protein n=1 Tax=Eleusine coracana subsp. coracana TaxID=191504 RepID=A0AAV5EH82_ELECO|nr:hypothetical protein PR202_gb10094 [Eleusine coracana subsp. coracana]
METTASPACEIARLPEEVLSVVISLTAPLDACRAAAVSPAFRAAADSDAVWACFLPRDLPPLADGELDPALPSKKALFMRLSASPVLLADSLTSTWLDRKTGAKCYMMSARALHISWGETPRYWRWIPLAKSDSRSANSSSNSDVNVNCVKKLQCFGMFAGWKSVAKCTARCYPRTLVMLLTWCKIDGDSYGLDMDYPAQEASVSIGESKSTRRVCVGGSRRRSRVRLVPFPADVQLPQERSDGWTELEMGELYNEEGEDGEVSISLMEIKGVTGRGVLLCRALKLDLRKKATLKRFKEYAVHQNASLLEICGTIHSKMLSQNSTYAAYMVFGIAMESHGLRYPDQEASISIGEMRSTRQVCLGGSENIHGHTVPSSFTPPYAKARRLDGAMEVEMVTMLRYP